MYVKSTDERTKEHTFIQEIKKQLALMTSQEKDEWIIIQARLLDEAKRQDFLRSLSGEKLILNMPSNESIDEFCQQVSDGKICLEYETRYYEFDDMGNYIDDWKVWYNDPNQAMDFIDNIFKGCHDLNKLGEYEQVNRILGQICRLEFCIVEADSSEDSSADEEPFTIDKAYEYGMLDTNKVEVVYDWLYAFSMANKKLKAGEFAQQLIELLMLPLCNVMLPSNVITHIENQEVYNEMILLLEPMIERETKEVQEKCHKEYTREGYELRKKLERKMNLIKDLKALKEERENINHQILILHSSWRHIQELIKWLSYEPYIDDQIEIGEICDLCAALVRHLKDHAEPWKIRKQVLQDIVDHYGYDKYGCGQPMNDLLDVLCHTKEEYLEKADIMMQNRAERFQKQAAKIYYEYGHDEEYVLYLKSNLAKSADVYLELVEYYDSHGDKDEAIQVANEGLSKCRDSKITEIFAFLIKEAFHSGNKTEAMKLYRRAKQRKNVLISEIDKVCGTLK